MELPNIGYGAFLWKWLTVKKSLSLFSQNAPSQMFGMAQNTPPNIDWFNVKVVNCSNSQTGIKNISKRTWKMLVFNEGELSWT